MAITTNAADNEKYKFKEAASLLGQPGVVVINPDGSNVGSGTGGSSNQVQGTAADAATAVGNPVDVALEYLTSAPTLTNGQHKRLQGDVNGNLKTREQYASAAEDNTNQVFAMARKYVNSATYASSYSQDLGSNATANVKAAAGSVVYIRASNANAAARYVQIHNKASAASAGETALRSYIIPAGTAAAPAILELTQEDFGGPVVCSTGVTWAISTAAATYTAATASEHTININFV